MRADREYGQVGDMYDLCVHLIFSPYLFRHCEPFALPSRTGVPPCYAARTVSGATGVAKSKRGRSNLMVRVILPSRTGVPPCYAARTVREPFGRPKNPAALRRRPFATLRVTQTLSH